MPVTIKAELRKYQQEGVNWLAFLAKYQLHGILCDGEYEQNHKVDGGLNHLPRYGSWKNPSVDMYFGEQTL